MPVPTDTFWNIRKLNVIFAASSLLLLASVLWFVKPRTAPSDEATMQTTIRKRRRSGRIRHIGTSSRSGGTGRNELSANAIAARSQVP